MCPASSNVGSDSSWSCSGSSLLDCFVLLPRQALQSLTHALSLPLSQNTCRKAVQTFAPMLGGKDARKALATINGERVKWKPQRCAGRTSFCFFWKDTWSQLLEAKLSHIHSLHSHTHSHTHTHTLTHSFTLLLETGLNALSQQKQALKEQEEALAAHIASMREYLKTLRERLDEDTRLREDAEGETEEIWNEVNAQATKTTQPPTINREGVFFSFA